MTMDQVLKERKQRPEGQVNESPKISHETFGRYPRITAKHASKITYQTVLTMG
jgi:hypothetical protein